MDYSDGDDSEEYLRDVIASASDVSSWSPELIGAIRDWPSEYHLSPVRHNLLRPFAFKITDSVLELGGGCGAITRYVGENVGELISVEGSLRRAEIAASRCRDLPNVSVYCEKLLGFCSEKRFDYVLLIGVLEYAIQFGQGPDAIGDTLRHAHSLLKPNGRLVLAIENKLGLKYFAGCAEDHNGIPFFGISDLYTQGTAVTFGRRELTEHLRSAGFRNLSFFYPFPDYKLPTVLLSEIGLLDAKLNVPDLLLGAPSRDYGDDRFRCFDEGLAWGALHANGLIGDLANSFLIFASMQNAKPEDPWHCKLYNRTLRHRSMAVETVISVSPSETALQVQKIPLYPTETLLADGAPIIHEALSSDYLRGHLLLNDIRKVMARNGSLKEVASSFEAWVTLLKRNKTTGTHGGDELPGTFIDCLPFNVLRDPHTDDLYYFDVEWSAQDPIPFSWVFIRGVIYALSGSMHNPRIASLSCKQVIQSIAQDNSIVISDHDFILAADLESTFFKHSAGNPKARLDLNALYEQPLYLKSPYSRDDRNELQRVKSTVSWRITAPMRVAWNAYLSFKRRISSTLN